MNDKFEAEGLKSFKEISIQIKYLFEYEEIFCEKNKLNAIQIFLENQHHDAITLRNLTFELFEYNNNVSRTIEFIIDPINLEVNNTFNKKLKVSDSYFDDFLTFKQNLLNIKISYFEKNGQFNDKEMNIEFTDLTIYRINNERKRIPSKFNFESVL